MSEDDEPMIIGDNDTFEESGEAAKLEVDDRVTLLFKFYKENLIFEDAKPNPAHYKLAELENEGKVKAIITQNIDGLHQKAGSKNVLELHGSTHRIF